MTTEDLDKKILKIHRSTKTVFPFMSPIHNKLRSRLGWYHKWHLQPYHQHVHYSVLAATIASVVVFLGMLSPSITGATGSSVSVQDNPGAVVLNTGAKIYFSSGGFGANVKIDNYTRELSGFAWSEDLGWIDFANTGASPRNPVKADKDGRLSGAALVLSTAEKIDFGENNSNVAVSSDGSFSGYAFSSEVGWIDFAGVKAPLYSPDFQIPDNPTLVSVKDSFGGSKSLTSDSWYNYTTPSFSWSTPTDYASGVTPAGIAGYLVYFGTNNSVNITRNVDDLVSVGENNGSFNWQTGHVYTNSQSLTTNQTYYLKVIAVDGAGNVHYLADSADYNLYTYKYDGIQPTPPLYVSASPSGYSRNNNFTFSWPVGGLSGATDTGGSTLGGYRYKINGGEWQLLSGGASVSNVTLTDVASSGLNTFDLESVDVAGNSSVNSVRTNFYFNDAAPGAPLNLTVTPSDSNTNSFAFNWEAPAGEIEGYYFSINALPTESNINFTTNTSLPAGPYATQQGENTLYIVAKDKAGNYEFNSCANITGNSNVDGCAKVVFSAVTTAPAIPTAVQVYDISNRDTKDYAIAVKWTASANQGNNFSGYDIYRSVDGVSFSQVGTTSSTIYADGGLESKMYYYYLKAKDSAGKYSANSTVVSLAPTGRYTTAPKLVSGPTLTISPTSVSVHWVTDRVASSFVQIKEGNTFVSEQGQTEQTTDHTVRVVGLRSQKDYLFFIRSTDIDGNVLESSESKFTTANTPSVYDLNVSNITQNSAIINFKSTAIANFLVHYGESSDYGKTIQEDSNSSTTNHSISLSGLTPGKMYFFRVVGDDSEGNELKSENSFLTLPLPEINHFEVIPDKEAVSTTVNVSWRTNVPTSTTVKYSLDGKTYFEKSSVDLVLDHTMSLSDLQDDQKYTIYAFGRDGFGNSVESEKMVFATPNDTRAPKISGVVIETSNIGNSNTRAQVVISWKTDEAANSQVEFDTGISGDQYTRKTVLDGTYTNRHLVIISDLDPGKPYHLRIIAADQAGNITKSGDNTVITGEVSRSALQTIVNTLQNIFGWMGGWIK